MFSWLKRSDGRATDGSGAIAKDAEAARRVGGIHSLANNYNLTAQEHARCVDWAKRIQLLYDGTESYCQARGLDRDVAFAANEWAGLIAREGLKFTTAYNDINYLRLRAPFAGYHMLVLDRLDVRDFPDDWSEPFVIEMKKDGIPDDIVEQVGRRLDPRDRLLPVVPSYMDHVRNVPSRYVVRTPRIFGEIGIDVDGVLVNQDVILCQSRINGMLASGVLDKLDRDIARKGHARVLEIGPGHGGLGYALRNIFGDRLEYIGVDLPASLYFSSLYLATTAGWQGSHLLLPGEAPPQHFNYLFLANYMLEDLADALGPVDLAMNCMSFTEMSTEQIRSYGLIFKRLLGSDGIVFEENHVNRSHHTDIKAIFSEIFPYRRAAASTVVTTKNHCQDIWASRYLGEIFDRQDILLQRGN